MANLTPTPSFDSVYRLEPSDPVVAGPGGISNRQAQQLLNRTEWLQQLAATESAALESAEGATLVGFQWPVDGALASTVDAQLKAGRVIAFESLGGVGDGDIETGTGTANDAAFVRARLAGEAGYTIQFKAGAQYKTTQQIAVHNMTWLGDFNNPPIIFGWFDVSGVRIIGRTIQTQKKNATILGVRFHRTGPNTEHGILIDNMESFTFDGWVTAKQAPDTVVKGGAIGVSPFQPEHRPSTNVNVKARLTNSANFGVQFGNVDGGTVQVLARNCMREVIGIEPYVLGAFDFENTAVTGDTINLPQHGIPTGWPMMYIRLSAATVIPGLPSVNYWFAIAVDENNIKLAATEADAIAGVSVTLGAVPVGTHRLYRCGWTKDVKILPSTIDNDNPPIENYINADDGVVVITATSCGYVSGLDTGDVIINDVNNRAPGYCVTALGVTDVNISGFKTYGGRLGAIRVNQGKLVGLRNNSGTSITPAVDTFAVPQRLNVSGNDVTNFPARGIAVIAGTANVWNNSGASSATGAIGVSTPSSASSSGFNRFRVPNGSAYATARVGQNNIDLATSFPNTASALSKFSAQTGRNKSVTPGSGVFNVTSFTNVTGNVSVYAGSVKVIARHADSSNANIAEYELAVMKSNPGATTSLTLVRESGLTGGGGANQPSFTWAMAGDTLVATPKGSTSTTNPFFFDLITSGDLLTV